MAPGRADRILTFADLDAASGLGASALGAVGDRARAGRNVVLACNDPLAFVTAFFSAAKNGDVPVPGPSRPLSSQAHLRRLLGIVEASRASIVVTDEPSPTELRERLEGTGVVVVPAVDLNHATRPYRTPRPNDTAYVQYTSGSVAAPKPIMIRQRQALAQLAQAAAAYAEDRSSVSVNWVPLYHDMGLVTSVLRPLWSDYTSVVLDPMDFVRDPGYWLAEMTRWRATHTSAPDFGYALCATRVAAPERFNLTSLRVARSAGEMVRARTIAAFTEAFRPSGYDPIAFKPSYGMAEATLTVTTCPRDEPPRLVRISRRAFRDGVVGDPQGEDDVLEFVSSGRPLAGTTVTVVAPSGEVLPEGAIGEVVVSGPQLVSDDFATGDLGFLVDGELVLIGRSHERFQIHGENFYSGEIETLVTEHEPRVRGGRVAAFVASTDGAGPAGLVLLAELRREYSTAPAEQAGAIAKHIRRVLSREFGLSVQHVGLFPPKSLPVTTSGKLCRDRCRLEFERAGDGAFAPVTG
ncbi:AMP-binding protein [Plantactinospora sp. S1510]|uniref:AMP-binding protein n=1 Tax=Plantactinospora alkalitolerans TaxID=2789879 RepID=A0ABS0H223_9ACTN|nr:AMP-binding protein [Plantactinospora alkalitolerans]MBF9132192.1 AMP-binding protein [Plantactinospora alkalitolerans]